MTKVLRAQLIVAALIFVSGLLSERTALALPRFAARNGMECIQCHVNPTGGGVRNEYGANVFEKVWLPISSAPTSWLAEPPQQPPSEEKKGEEGEAKPDEAQTPPPAESSMWTFSGTVFDWLSIGGDLRVAYLLVRPDEPSRPGASLDVTSSFFLMQGDLYHAARLNPWVTLVLDVGVYSGFEAWGLVRPFRDAGSFDLAIKAGRFLPPFGIREVEHQLFTREGVGLGATDRDTGVELTAYLGPITWSTAVMNGTLGDTAFDTTGTERRTFEKAVASRLAGRFTLGRLRLQLGGSVYFNDDVNQPNPLFTGILPSALQSKVGQGLDELRFGGFLTANLGRFTYLADLVVVRDAFNSPDVPRLQGHASYQELSFVPMQGLEFVLTHEYMDQDHDLAGTSTHRVGFVTELFPVPFTELRLMTRRTLPDQSKTGGTMDLVLFLHLFM